jgi:very-short-patch-repair endonuclease
MACTTLQTLSRAVWALARRQHGVVARRQLIELGASRSWIEHRIARGRLHPIHRGVYAVGRPELTREGRWMAAVLACGPGAHLSHQSAGAGWQMLPKRPKIGAPTAPIHVCMDAALFRQPPAIRVHRTSTLVPDDLTTHRGIPVTSPSRTLIDLATMLPSHRLEAAVNEADKLDLVDPETLRLDLEHRKGQPGVPRLRALLDRHTFRLTDSELERRFLRIVRKTGLPLPETQIKSSGHRVDFYWPELGLIVETDGLRYHRTPAQQAKDNRRMQAHAAAGRTAIRISHYEIRFECDRVVALLTDLIRGRTAA